MSDNDLKILHTTQFIYTLDEQKKSVFAASTWIQRLRYSVKPALCFSIGFWLAARNWLESHLVGWFTLLSFPLFVLLCDILLPLVMLSKALADYKSKPWLDGLTINYAFLTDRVELRGFAVNHKADEEKVLKYMYYNFIEIIETRTNFYLSVNELGEKATFMILKENCTPELIEFIRKLPVKKRNQK